MFLALVSWIPYFLCMGARACPGSDTAPVQVQQVQLQEPTSDEFEARQEHAGQLLAFRKYDQANPEFLWLWQHVYARGDPAVYTHLIESIQRLCREYPPAMDVFAPLRDALNERVESVDATTVELEQWIVLNRMLGQNDRSVSWFDRARKDPARAARPREYQIWLFDALVEAKRYADAGMLLSDPVAFATSWLPWAARSDAHVPFTDDVRRMITRVYAACLAAGREDEAAKIAEKLLQADDTPASRIALVHRALIVGAPRQQHRQWLAEAEARGENVDKIREQLDAALK